MSYSIPMAYIQGVQAKLLDAGVIQYPNEKIAMEDAQNLGQSLEQQTPVDQGGLATEGAAPEETQAVATALMDMAEQAGEEAQVAGAKAQIVQEAVSKVASYRPSKFSKFSAEAGAPGDNNIVAGHKPGKIAPGESSARKEDLNKELANAMPVTAERPAYWNSKPGQQIDEGKGEIGQERDHEGRNAQGGMVPDSRELSNAVPNTKERPNYHGGPGDQKDEDKGHVGTEKGASLSDVLARL